MAPLTKIFEISHRFKSNYDNYIFFCFSSNHHSSISWCSLDPDSLEIERHPYAITKSNTQPTISITACLPTTTEKDRSVSTFSVNSPNVIYAEPKAILRHHPQTVYESSNLRNKQNIIYESEDNTNYFKSIRRQTIGPIYGNVEIEARKADEQAYCKSNEIFVDSLEPYVEVATSF